MSTYPLNGHWEDDVHWQASLEYAQDQERHPWPARDLRTPCSNVNCDQLTDEALFCSEQCRAITEGPDHEIELDEEMVSTCLPVVALLPEAPCSVNVHVPIAGRDVQITLRGTNEAEVLRRLEQLLARYPVQASAAPAHGSDNGWCAIHQTAMKEQHGKDGSTWHSHKTPDGWCKGKAVRHD